MNDALETYYSDDHPGYRVNIMYDMHAGNPHGDWSMLSEDMVFFEGPAHWPSAKTLNIETCSVKDLESDELREYLDDLRWYMPTAGLVIGFQYLQGYYLRPTDAPIEEWDGFFHITEQTWREMMGDDPAGRTYTSRYNRALEIVAGECKAISAWMEGNVYGWVLEQETVWTNDSGATRTTWETVDSVWGYYGLDEWEYMVSEAWPAAPAEGQAVAA